MSERPTWGSPPPYAVKAACVLIGIGCALFFVTLVRDGGTDEVNGAEWVIGSLLICSALGYAFIHKILRQTRPIAWLAMVLAGTQVLAGPAEWSYEHSVSAAGVARVVIGGAIVVLLALPSSRAWFRPVD